MASAPDRAGVCIWLAAVERAVAALALLATVIVALWLAPALADISAHAAPASALYWVFDADDPFPTRASWRDPPRPMSRQPLGPADRLQLSYLFQAPADLGDRPALLAPVIDGEATVFVNGVSVHASPRSSPPYLALSGARARLWTLPVALFRPGQNRIDILVGGARGRALRAPLYLAPLSRLEPAMNAIGRFEAVTRAGVSALGLIAAGLALLAGAALGGARPWIAFGAAASAAAARALVGSPEVMTTLGAAWRPLDLLLLAAMALCWALATGATEPRSGRLRRADSWLSVLTLTAGGLAASGLPWGLWTLGGESLYVLGALVLLLALALASAATAATVFRRRIIEQFDLARTVRLQQVEIQATSAALQQEMQRSAILEERQRLARDMHDGIGGQLASLLAQVRSRRITLDQMELALAGGLSELRLMVDSLDAVGESLSSALASFRTRARQQIEAAGMTLTWREADAPEGEARNPGWILNLYRLLQEAVTNAVRHSGGRAVTVRIDQPGDGRLVIVIEDDGEGFDPAMIQPGKGLANMAFRADQLGAILSWRKPASGIGTAVWVEVPSSRRV